MNVSKNTSLGINEVCESTQVSSKLIIKIVEYGIIAQSDPEPGSWTFNSETIPTIHKALRLRRDLKLNWAGVALAIDLIDEIETLRRESERLQHKLSRYIDEV